MSNGERTGHHMWRSNKTALDSLASLILYSLVAYAFSVCSRTPNAMLAAFRHLSKPQCHRSTSMANLPMQKQPS